MQRFFVLFRRNLATVFTMKRRLTIGADGNQVIDGIHHICFADLIQRNNVMHLNDILKFRTVSLFKTHPANFTGITMVSKASCASLGIAFILGGKYGFLLAFQKIGLYFRFQILFKFRNSLANQRIKGTTSSE